MKKISILDINHIARTWSGHVIKTINEKLPKEKFSYHTLVGYDFDSYPDTDSVYKTSKSIRYRQIRYKWWVWLNFLFDIMTPWCINIEYLRWYKQYQEADILHIHCPQWWYFDRRDLPEICKEKKVIMTLHDDWIVSGNDPVNLYYPYKIKRQFNKRNEILKKCNITYIWVSDRCTNKAKKSWITAHNPAKTIYNGINTDIFHQMNKKECREELWLPMNKTIMISIAGSGSKSNSKWLHYVNKIIKEYKDNDNYLFITVWNSKQKKVSNQLWEMWWINHDLMAKYFNAADILLYPTLMDNCPLTVLEATSCWLPVLSYDTGWVPELIQHKKNGYIAPYKNYDELKKWFERIVQNKDTLQISLESKFIQQSMIDQYIELYTSLIWKI